ncbi:5-dehydro-4-deoxyglucarate dehydratase [Streptomyces sp. RLB3-17]|uniref:5-dehydro-4-deoxyglucarate dehydratase n=1 Tax=unclassified Streptomyces TaxID=2593676 RepID=UPI0011649F78|nr:MULTISPECIES: 5-dehydro-4-deoxyglucarate dehydratase [unclassified Streptomyces]QDN54993.1 5-dehydro-4-deoxyglucarate dehydratase [Streptomyces sp. S1D4-20]QDN65172.1 5-dehydro-4-deoxyglucarate dehydratase [Streptomyces sp. S1D4-14]QDO37586.1 5-dehydro-4-deoxyglucarate dehydratase [Streptomyces sp. RLB3-17]QDO47579.1 5-dehydro-4-deoxyglucarate dehydratase [Streptomyces sp. RLB3-5]QDO57818.1 5-dehydro-4-deoxyglucarate dehydratase [Streptomyces sp. RLB1-8]
MTRFTAAAEDVAKRLRDGMVGGVLSFPLTSFREDGGLDLEAYRAYLTAQLDSAPGAVFPACGTGEFFSLDEDEYRTVVRATVEIADGRLPVVAGIGYGWAQALRFARIAEEAGADAALVLPHYLVAAPQDGLVEQLRRIASGTSLPLIAYQRGQVDFTADSLRRIAEIPTVIGLKDGHSDLDRLQRLTLAAPDDFLFFNGASTAEIQARAYATVGVPAYSSAVHAFAPEIANAFFAALRDGDDAGVTKLLRDFYVPLVELRDRVPGYAVSLVKAAAGLRGLPVGPVRAPLTDPGPEDLDALAKVLDDGLKVVGAVRGSG